MGRKAAGTTRSRNNAFGPGTANEHTVLWWFKKFCKGDKSLEDEQHSGWPSKADGDKIESHHGSWASHSCTRSGWRTRWHPFYYCLWHLKQSGKVRKLNKWVPRELTANQKNHFEVSSLTPCNYIKPFLVVCDVRWKVDFVQQPVVTSSVFGLRRSSEALPKARSVPKKITVTCLVVFCPSVYYSILNPSETITSEKHAQQINEMRWKLQGLQLALVNRKSPVLFHNNARPHMVQPALTKLNELGCEVLPHLPHSPDLSPSDCRLFKHLDNFLQGKHFHNRQEAKSAFQESAGKKVFIKSESTDFYAAGINKFISHCQKCVDFNG